MRELTRAEVTELLSGLGQPMVAGTWAAMVSRRQAPPPGRYVGRTPLWSEEIVREWATNRPGRGARTDLRQPRVVHGVVLDRLALAQDIPTVLAWVTTNEKGSRRIWIDAQDRALSEDLLELPISRWDEKVHQRYVPLPGPYAAQNTATVLGLLRRHLPRLAEVLHTRQAEFDRIEQTLRAAEANGWQVTFPYEAYVQKAAAVAAGGVIDGLSVWMPTEASYRDAVAALGAWQDQVDQAAAEEIAAKTPAEPKAYGRVLTGERGRLVRVFESKAEAAQRVYRPGKIVRFGDGRRAVVTSRATGFVPEVVASSCTGHPHTDEAHWHAVNDIAFVEATAREIAADAKAAALQAAEEAEIAQLKTLFTDVREHSTLTEAGSRGDLTPGLTGPSIEYQHLGVRQALTVGAAEVTYRSWGSDERTTEKVSTDPGLLARARAAIGATPRTIGHYTTHPSQGSAHPTSSRRKGTA